MPGRRRRSCAQSPRPASIFAFWHAGALTWPCVLAHFRPVETNSWLRVGLGLTVKGGPPAALVVAPAPLQHVFAVLLVILAPIKAKQFATCFAEGLGWLLAFEPTLAPVADDTTGVISAAGVKLADCRRIFLDEPFYSGVNIHFRNFLARARTREKCNPLSDRAHRADRTQKEAKSARKRQNGDGRHGRDGFSAGCVFLCARARIWGPEDRSEPSFISPSNLLP
jgi:hypothetical protein